MEQTVTSDGDWTPQRERVDAAAFMTRCVGPYRLGQRLRGVPYGQVTLAIHDGFEEVVELEQYDDLARTTFAGPDGALLGDVSASIGLQHRYLSPLIGAGIDTGVPYIVRAHRLGRTLAEVLTKVPQWSTNEVAAILYPIAECIAYLAEEGAQPGACAPGGFDARDVHLGFDGSITLLGNGLKLLRCPVGDPVALDFEALLNLATDLDRRSQSSLQPVILEAGSATEAVAAIRRSQRKGVTEGAARLGAILRTTFGEEIREERSFFGLPTLH